MIPFSLNARALMTVTPNMPGTAHEQRGARPVDHTTGSAWAAAVQSRAAGWWLVLWGPYRQQLTAFYQGPAVRGIWFMRPTPQELWDCLVREGPPQWLNAVAAAYARSAPPTGVLPVPRQRGRL